MESVVSANARPLPTPLPYEGRQQILVPGFPKQIDSEAELEAFILKKLNEMHTQSPKSAEQLAFRIIHHTRLTPKILQFLRRKYLPNFSSLTWREDIFPAFSASLNTTIYSDHRSIQPYMLKRSRIPISTFREILKELDVSRRNLGERSNLENEAAVQLYIHPIPNAVLSLFRGRLTNMPEHLLKGQIANSGRCEFTIGFNGRLMLLFIELKQELTNNHAQHSDIIAQVIGEADGADTSNCANEFDGFPIHAVLTDGIHYEFYLVSFHSWSIYRGTGEVDVGIRPWQTNKSRISLPPDEQSPEYRPQLKIIIELLFDTFLQAYLNGIVAQLHYSARRARFQNTEVGSGYSRRHSTGEWDRAYLIAFRAAETLRAAHTMRLESTVEADKLADLGVQQLFESAACIPHPELDWSFLDDWDAIREELMRI